jgi:hypothetical protein
VCVWIFPLLRLLWFRVWSRSDGFNERREAVGIPFI